MTSLLSLLPRPRQYSSVEQFKSAALPGVTVVIRKMSLGRRIELAREVREFAGRLEFHEAGKGVADKIDAAALAAEIDAIYLRWGLASIDGLHIDGLPATADTVIAGAPETFIREVIGRIKRECGMSEPERKN